MLEPKMTSTMMDSSLYKYTPALLPPPGVTPNFTNPESRGPMGLVIATMLLGLMILFYAVRVYVRCVVSRKLFWDDFTCTLSMVGVVAYYGDFVWACTSGPLRVHQWDLHLDRVWTKDWIIACYISIILYAPIMLAIKFTFFLLYLHVFRQNKRTRISIYVGAFATTGFYVSMAVARLVLITPSLGTPWMGSALRNEIDKSARLSLPTATIGLAIDLYILILPVGAVLHLHIPNHRKVKVFLVSITGILACIASALSVYFRARYKFNQDKTWHTFDIQLFTCVEMFIGVVCTCMPSFSKMLHHHDAQLQRFMSFSFFRDLRTTLIRRDDKGSLSDNASSQKKTSCQTLNFAPVNDVVVSTFIGSGQRVEVADDVIHLIHEVEQRECKARS